MPCPRLRHAVGGCSCLVAAAAREDHLHERHEYGQNHEPVLERCDLLGGKVLRDWPVGCLEQLPGEPHEYRPRRPRADIPAKRRPVDFAD